MGGCLRKMNENVNLTVNRSIESLPIECLLMIFKYLKFDDLVNVAKTCRLFESIVREIFHQNVSVTLDRDVVAKGEKHVDLMFSYIGEYVRSLEIDCSLLN